MRSTVEIALRVEDHTSQWLRSVRTLSQRTEVIQHGFRPRSAAAGGRAQLIYRAVLPAAFPGAALLSGAIEIAVGIENQSAFRHVAIHTVRQGTKAIEHALAVLRPHGC